MKNRSTPGLSRYLCLKRIIAAAVSFVVLAAAFCFQSTAISGNGLVEGQIAGINVVSGGLHWKGQLEYVSPTTIRGWAWRVNGPAHNYVQVFVEDVCHNSNIIAQDNVLANIYRTDLANAGIGNGDRGFQWNWDPTAKHLMHKLRIRVVILEGSHNYWLTNNTIADHRMFYYDNNHRLTGGVGTPNSRYYWIDNSLYGYSVFPTQINNARNEWVNTGSILSTPIYFYEKTANNSGTAVDFYHRHIMLLDPISGEFVWPSGITEYFKTHNNSSLQVYCDNSDWEWAKISLNSSTSSNNPLQTYLVNNNTAKIRGVIAHEWGHAMGLEHPNETVNGWTYDIVVHDRLMTPYPGRQATRASWLDLASINLLY